MMRINIRTKMISLIVLAIFSTISILWIQFLQISLTSDVYFNISCYFEPGDELPYMDDNFQRREHSIFFHETSCKGGLNSRQACAVEAAARWNPLWDVHVLFISPVKDLRQKSIITLKKFKNVKFLRLNLEDYAKGTPLETLVTSGAWKRTKWMISHTSDLLRYLTLYKWGGIYLDLDTVVVKPLGDLAPNWAAKESDWAVAAGAMAFSNDKVGRMVAENTIMDLVKNWSGDNWGNNGPGVITRVLTRMCDTKNFDDMNAETCQGKGFEVYNQKQFYPIGWRSAIKYFEPPNTTYPEAYVFHVWNHLTNDKAITKGSFYDLLAKEHCPDIYMVYGKDFGKLPYKYNQASSQIGSKSLQTKKRKKRRVPTNLQVT